MVTDIVNGNYHSIVHEGSIVIEFWCYQLKENVLCTTSRRYREKVHRQIRSWARLVRRETPYTTGTLSPFLRPVCVLPKVLKTFLYHCTIKSRIKEPVSFTVPGGIITTGPLHIRRVDQSFTVSVL